MKVELVDVLRAITSVMPCEKCPYPCQARENSSQANCDRRWYEILSSLPQTSRDVWLNEMTRRMERG